MTKAWEWWPEPTSLIQVKITAINKPNYRPGGLWIWTNSSISLKGKLGRWIAYSDFLNSHEEPRAKTKKYCHTYAQLGRVYSEQQINTRLVALSVVVICGVLVSYPNLHLVSWFMLYYAPFFGGASRSMHRLFFFLFEICNMVTRGLFSILAWR